LVHTAARKTLHTHPRSVSRFTHCSGPGVCISALQASCYRQIESCGVRRCDCKPSVWICVIEGSSDHAVWEANAVYQNAITPLLGVIERNGCEFQYRCEVVGLGEPAVVIFVCELINDVVASNCRPECKREGTARRSTAEFSMLIASD